jgi:tetratricopeptide (TPR) repeat protein
VGLFYICIVGGIALLRREGLSVQFALEALGVTGIFLLVGLAIDVVPSPILLFILLYIITMRARLLTDLANLLFTRRGYAAAEPLYRLALRLYPDPPSRAIVLINWGVARLQSGETDVAISMFRDVLASADAQGGLGEKYEAACRYNLAIACSRAGRDGEAAQQFMYVSDQFPASVYGQAAERNLAKRRDRGLSLSDE